MDCGGIPVFCVLTFRVSTALSHLDSLMCLGVAGCVARLALNFKGAKHFEWKGKFGSSGTLAGVSRHTNQPC